MPGNESSTESLMDKLWLAAYQNKASKVASILKKGINPDVSSTESTPLWIACTQGNLEPALLLIAAGANVNAKCEGISCLCAAAENGHSTIVTELINAGCDINLPTQKGDTPLGLATLNGHEECVEKLIAAGADVNIVTREGRSALLYAHSKERESIAKKLIAAGAKPEYSGGALRIQFKKYLAWAVKFYPEKYDKDNIAKIYAELDHGFCLGWSLLHVAIPEEDWGTFYSNIRKLVHWNGDEEQLINNKELQDLFEQMFNDLRWLSNLHTLVNTTYKDGHQLINIISSARNFKEAIFNFDSFLFLEPAGIKMILKLIADPGKKINIISSGVQGPESHSILLVKQLDGRYKILDIRSGVGPLIYTSLEDVISALYNMFETEENTNIGLNFCIYENLNSADKEKYGEHKQHLFNFFVKEKNEDKFDKSNGEEVPSKHGPTS